MFFFYLFFFSFFIHTLFLSLAHTRICQTMILFVLLYLPLAIHAHSWLFCIDDDTSQYISQMKAKAANLEVMEPPYSACRAFPRGKQNPGNWIDESTNYIWDLQKAAGNGDTSVCHPNQRSPNQFQGAPMATASPGSSLKLRFGGNGHSRGGNVPGGANGNSGTVQVYTYGEPGREIVDVSELPNARMLGQAGFADDAINFRDTNGMLQDKGNWFNLQLPQDLAEGRHMFVWTWQYAGVQAWSTCFDVYISGSSETNPSTNSSTTNSSIKLNANSDDTTNKVVSKPTYSASNSICSLDGLIGGMSQRCSFSSCPPCRILHPGSKDTTDCYDSLPDGSCPFKSMQYCS